MSGRTEIASDSVEVSVSAAPGNEYELNQFRGWLHRDPTVSGSARVEMHSASDGEAGSDVEVVNVVFDHALEVPSLLMSYSAWRQSRVTAPELTFTRGGITVTVGDDSPEVIAAVIIELLTADREAAAKAATAPVEPGETTG